MEKKKCTITFTGDIGFDRYMARRWTDSELLSEGILDFFSKCFKRRRSAISSTN